MLARMLRKAKAIAPSLTVAALTLGLAAPAFADVAPGPRERKTKTLEPHEAPPAELEAPPEPEPEAEPETEPAPEAKPEVETKPEVKSEPEPKKAEAAKNEKSGSCSIDDGSQHLFGLAALVLLISGASLRRRSRPERR